MNEVVGRLLQQGVHLPPEVHNGQQETDDDFEGSFEKLLDCIRRRDKVDPSKLLPYLCQESKQQRAFANLQLAQAFFFAQDIKQAKVFADRAWILSDFCPELLPFYREVALALGDTECIRQAYKRLGISYANSGDFVNAIECFDNFQYAYGNIEHVDKYEFDFDVFDAVERMSQPHRFSSKIEPLNCRRLKIGYLLRGITYPNMNLMIISQLLAEFHDRKRFDVHFFSLHSPEELAESDEAQKWCRGFRDVGYEIVPGPSTSPGLSRRDWILAAARQIKEANLDVLVTSMAPGSFFHYFVACLRPAPVIIGLVQGAPAIYSGPAMDWCISWSKHPLMDTPVGCSLIALKQRRPRASEVKAHSKLELGIPEQSCVVVGAGRVHKFQSVEYWNTIAEILEAAPQAYYLVVGCEAKQVPAAARVPEHLKSRIRFFGWRSDFIQFLAAADVVVDTFPDGGGQVIWEALCLGKAIVACRNDFMRTFDMMHWSPVEDFIDDPEVVVKRGDLEAFKQMAIRLITDTAFREKTAQRCGRFAAEIDVRSAVSACEQVYAEQVARKAFERLISKPSLRLHA